MMACDLRTTLKRACLLVRVIRIGLVRTNAFG
jgi:hypothetical protein